MPLEDVSPLPAEEGPCSPTTPLQIQPGELQRTDGRRAAAMFIERWDATGRVSVVGVTDGALLILTDEIWDLVDAAGNRRAGRVTGTVGHAETGRTFFWWTSDPVA
jgi:lipopolysaccharide export LptBFGC system permease protein LptF